MPKWLRLLLLDRRGATAIEYGLIVALIVIAMIASLAALGNTTTVMWNNVHDKVGAVMPTQ